MLDKVLGVAASIDWITPLASVLGDLMNGPSHTFLIPYSASPLSGREIGWLLGKRGVKCWGLMVVSGTLMVSVRLGQATWAQQILEQAGVPLENPVPTQVQRGNRTRGTTGRMAARSHHRSAPRSDLGGIVDSVSDLLDTRLF